MTAAPLLANSMHPLGMPIHLGSGWMDENEYHHALYMSQSEQTMMPLHPGANYAMHPNQAILQIGENKPRLSKEQAERLERVFAQEYKPSTLKKKELANEMGVDVAKVNVSY